MVDASYTRQGSWLPLSAFAYPAAETRRRFGSAKNLSVVQSRADASDRGGPHDDLPLAAAVRWNWRWLRSSDIHARSGYAEITVS